jgi:hypothetical protein
MVVGAVLELRFAGPGGKGEVVASGRVLRCGPNQEDPDGLWPFSAAIEFDAPLEGLEGLLHEPLND